MPFLFNGTERPYAPLLELFSLSTHLLILYFIYLYK